MNKTTQITLLSLIISLVSACTLETRSEDNILRISFTPSHQENWSWAATTAMIFNHHNTDYSQNDIIDYYDYHYGYDEVSINEISWLLWDLAGIDSYLTGTLSLREIQTHINSGQPILLFYGDDYNGRYVLLHGYDDNGYLYLHEPEFGTRVIHYNSLYSLSFNNLAYYWSSSLLIHN
ncbi:MAG: hypothetical protein ACI8O8_001663 [Oleiphilaceae bacterium]|jgi:hypothetical protein